MLRSAALLVTAAALTACGQPQPPEPPPLPPPPPTAEAEPVLLGADPFAPELHAPEALPGAALAEARRPGWGTMAPIPNPPEYAASDQPPYRLIGPTLAEPVRRAQRPTPAARVAARLRPTPAAARPRVRHILLPGTRPGPSES